MTSASQKTLYCSFCGKSQHETRKLIAGPTVFICEECVALCNDIIAAEKPDFRREALPSDFGFTIRWTAAAAGGAA